MPPQPRLPPHDRLHHRSRSGARDHRAGRGRQGAARAGDPAALSGLLRPGGTVASTLGTGAEQFGRDDLTVTPIMAAATADTIAALLDQVAAKTLRVNVHTAVPLDRAQEAFDAFAGGTLGKALITR